MLQRLDSEMAIMLDPFSVCFSKSDLVTRWAVVPFSRVQLLVGWS